MGTTDIEEHWRMLFLERLQKLEANVDAIRVETSEIKTSSAVAASESKTRSETTYRIETDLRDVSKLLHTVIDTPRNQLDLDRRVKSLEEWQANLMGRLTILGIVASVLTSVVTAVLIKMLG